MATTTGLRQEHETIRQWLDRLEALLPVADERRLPIVFILRKITDRLAAHLARENELFSHFESAWWQRGTPPLGVIRHDHEDAQTTLNIIDQLLTKGHGTSLETLEVYIRHLLDTLREHMQEEETTLFPLIDRELVQREQATESISGMTINCIIRAFPETHPVFRRFRIDREQHGTEYLEEAAWYCGVCMSDVEHALRAAIKRQLLEPAPSSEPIVVA